MSHLAIFALGPLRIELDGKPLQTSRHKALALLVYLAMQRRKESREMLSGLFWPDYEQNKAFAYLRRTLWEIHNLLGKGWMDVDREAIGFSPNAEISLDVAEFQIHLAAANHRHAHPESGDCPQCAAHLHTAALLYRGDFLSGFNLRDSPGFEDWQFFQSQSLRRDYAHTLQELVSLLHLKGDYEQASVFARRWLALDPLIEDAHRELMKIYAQSGQRTMALRQYQVCERLLRTELGVAPETETTFLFEQIQSGALSRTDEIQAGQLRNTPQITSEPGHDPFRLESNLSIKETLPAGTLPAQNRAFVGRQAELEQIAGHLANPACWLVTLFGPGGIGKTRLALEVGKQQQKLFFHGVFFVPLNTLESSESIVPAIAKAAGLILRQDGPSPDEQLLDFLHEKHMLLILDSFEMLVHSSDLLVAIHQQASGIKMLVTTRQRLPLNEAWVVEIKGLDYPLKQAINNENYLHYSAVELFLLASRRADAEFQIHKTDLPAVTRITQLLEGMPLGLELAATWIKMLPCQGIADELARSLDFLETPLQDLPERQHSIRAVFDYSWNLLNNREQRLFPRLAVFRGGFTHQAAEQVAGISLRELAGFVDKSLVQRISADRFGLHDLLRQYSLENLDRLPVDRQETFDRHSAFFCARMAIWHAELGGDKPGRVLQEIDSDLENARAAWEWAVTHHKIDRLELANEGMCMFFLRRARLVEGLAACQWAETVLQNGLSLDGQKLRARLLIWLGVFSMNLAAYQDAGLFLDKSQTIIDDLAVNGQQIVNERYFLLTIQAENALLQYNLPSCMALLEQSFDLAQISGLTVRWAVFYWRYLMSGGTASDNVYRLLKEILPYVRKTGDLFETGCTLYILGIIEAFWYYRIAEAEPLLKESAAIFQKLDDPVSQGMIYKTQGFLFLFQGNFTDHLALKQREMMIYQDLGDRQMTGLSHCEVGECFYHLGRYEEAENETRMGIDLLNEKIEHEYALRHRYLGDTLLAQGRHQEACDAYQFSCRFFQTVGEKTWTVTALTGLSRAELALGDRSAAWEHAVQALRICREGNVLNFFIYQTLAVFALLLADLGDIHRALELFGLASRHLTLARSHWFADLFSRFINEAAQTLPIEEQAQATSHGLKQELSWAVDGLYSDFAKMIFPNSTNAARPEAPFNSDL